MALIASRLIYATMGIVADHLFGDGKPGQAQVILGRLFQSHRNVFSYRLADAAVIGGEPVGLLLSAPWPLMQRLRLPTAVQIARSGGIPTLLRLIARSTSLGGATEAEDDEYFVAHVAVLPEFQGRGLGALLMGHAQEKAGQFGLIKVALTVATDNVGAISFYSRLGFKIVGTSRFPALEKRIGYTGFHRMRKRLV